MKPEQVLALFKLAGGRHDNRTSWDHDMRVLEGKELVKWSNPRNQDHGIWEMTERGRRWVQHLCAIAGGP